MAYRGISGNPGASGLAILFALAAPCLSGCSLEELPPHPTPTFETIAGSTGILDPGPGDGLGPSDPANDSVPTCVTGIIRSKCTSLCHTPSTLAGSGNLNLSGDLVATLRDQPAHYFGLTPAEAAKCIPGAKLIDSEAPLASVFLRKITRSPSCGEPMPLNGVLDVSETVCLQQWVNSFDRSNAGGTGGTGGAAGRGGAAGAGGNAQGGVSGTGSGGAPSNGGAAGAAMSSAGSASGGESGLSSGGTGGTSGGAGGASAGAAGFSRGGRTGRGG